MITQDDVERIRRQLQTTNQQTFNKDSDKKMENPSLHLQTT